MTKSHLTANHTASRFAQLSTFIENKCDDDYPEAYEYWWVEFSADFEQERADIVNALSQIKALRPTDPVLLTDVIAGIVQQLHGYLDDDQQEVAREDIIQDLTIAIRKRDAEDN